MRRVKTETVPGNAPECPKCKRWNALLDGCRHEPDAMIKIFECRDCGWKVDATDLIIVLKKRDKPGMGHMTTFHVVKEIPGEEF